MMGNGVTADRRSRLRLLSEDRLTKVVESIRLDPVKAARDLRRETHYEVDLVATRELLESAEQVAHRRGLNLRPEIITVWTRITAGLG